MARLHWLVLCTACLMLATQASALEAASDNEVASVAGATGCRWKCNTNYTPPSRSCTAGGTHDAYTERGCTYRVCGHTGVLSDVCANITPMLAYMRQNYEDTTPGNGTLCDTKVGAEVRTAEITWGCGL